MIKNTVNTQLCICGGGVEPSSRATFRSCKNDFKKILAFTLAETLIVMGIIGIVAALTLPNLNSSTSDKEKVSSVKKIYAELVDAEGRAEAVYGPISEWFTSDMDSKSKGIRYGERMSEFMKVSKVCNNTDGCFAKVPKFDLFGDNDDEIDDFYTFYSVILSSGASVSFGDGGVPFLFFDIDGPNKGKNKLANDIFYVPIDGEYRFNPALYVDEFWGAEDSVSDVGYNIFAQASIEWVLRYGNMDYLKVGANGKCPDGKTVLTWDEQTSCK